ncbi:proliferating cell nuclear antigen (pcna) [Candidatus Woesearchaeota archaeon CG10_big_fil_rev_8_21_14_0_10_45_5]|nr:MAG: proliferating cell nuclear antigen (pcna) [Candidatus Woesearchaeota archaeon CG10_big_fil_rev_8_21_14_0_10_45_5]PIU29631.1 MAG: proliferating cell nuclear antigen (pcna) [Candidatus Woesearchaeota archaeon CG07_land_8_20_14_0_80_44_23]
MKLALAEPKYLKDSISIISELVNEARMKITSDCIEIIAMDPANVAMVAFKLLSSAFVEYDIEKPTELGINLSNLKQILKRAGSNETMIIETAENRLKITLDGNTKRTFLIPLIDLEEKEQKVPELKFTAKIKTSSSTLSSSIEDADIVAESVTFAVEPQRFIISAEGDLSKAQVEIKASESTKIELKGEAVKARYSIEYLKKMMTASKLCENVSISMSNDYPLKLEYAETDKLMIAFILAPRIEND